LQLDGYFLQKSERLGKNQVELRSNTLCFACIFVVIAGIKLYIMPTNNDHRIRLEVAVFMTANYRAHQPENLPISETFGLEAVRSLINHEGCAMLRIYYGMKADMQIHAILVAADAEGNDLLPSEATNTLTGDDYAILEDGFRCPVTCPAASPLNS